MADEERVVLVVDNGNLSAVLAHLPGLNQDHKSATPLYDRDYDLRASDYDDGFIHGDDVHEVVDLHEKYLDDHLEETFGSEWRSYYTDEPLLTRKEIEEEQRLFDEATDRYLPAYSSCCGFGSRKEYKLVHDSEDERFGRRRWTDSKDHLRRKVRSRFFRKVRLLQSTSLTDHDATDPLDAFLDEDDMAEIVALREMGFYDLAARL